MVYNAGDAGILKMLLKYNKPQITVVVTRHEKYDS